MASIFHQIIIQAEKQVIFDAITTQKGLSSWWIKDCEALPEKGHVNTFKVEGYPLNKMKITRFKANDKLTWKCIGGDKDWIGTKISFIIKEGNSGNILQFKHSKWKKKKGFFATCSFHWARHLIMLQYYCENGKPILDENQESSEIEKVKKQN